MQKKTKLLIGGSVATIVAVAAVIGASHADRYEHRKWKGGHRGHMIGMGVRSIIGPRMFDGVDLNRDGKVTQAEIDTARKARFQKYDTDKNGDLTLEEFDGLWREMTEILKVRAFQMLDSSGNAKITKGEFDWPFSRLVERFDRDGDGALSFGEHKRHHRRDRQLREPRKNRTEK